MNKDRVLGERQTQWRHSVVRMGHECELISGEAVSNQTLLRGSFILHLRESCSSWKGVQAICLEDKAWSKGAGTVLEQLPFSSVLLVAITGFAFQHLQLSKEI